MKWTICFALILFCSISVFTQVTPQYLKFNAAYSKGFLNITNGGFRTFRISRNFTEGKPESLVLIKEITEIVSHIQHSTSIFPSNPKAKPTERIVANGKLYTRQENGEWSVRDFPSQSDTDNTNKGIARFKRVYEFYNYKDAVTEILDNQKTLMYESNSKYKLIDTEKNTETPTTNVSKYWFAEDGRILKEEFETISYYPDKTKHQIETRTYEADPSIKIEVPIIKAAE